MFTTVKPSNVDTPLKDRRYSFGGKIWRETNGKPKAFPLNWKRKLSWAFFVVGGSAALRTTLEETYLKEHRGQSANVVNWASWEWGSPPKKIGISGCAITCVSTWLSFFLTLSIRITREHSRCVFEWNLTLLGSITNTYCRYRSISNEKKKNLYSSGIRSIAKYVVIAANPEW